MRSHDHYYKSGRKANWRRSVWNNISSRVRDKKNANVLYLSAMDDRDRAVAVSKGFSPNNLISVDTDERVIKKIRGEGKIAIHGNLRDVVYAWPCSSHIDVIFADMMSGISNDICNMIWAAMVSPATDTKTVVVINCLRGREAAAPMDMIKHYRLATGSMVLHRGKLLELFLIMTTLGLYADYKRTEPDNLAQEDLTRVTQWVREASCPRFFSYRSDAGKQRFDTIIYSNLFPKSAVAEETAWMYRASIAEKITSVNSATLAVRAALAVQSMRKSGRLPCAPRW